MARIPDEYQEVEYLRGTGTQYIRTSYFATGNTSVKIKFRINELQGFGIFGSRDTTTPTNAYLMWGAGAGFWRVQYGNQNFTSTIERDTEWHTWEQRQNVCFLDNKLFYTFDKQTFQNTYEQLLFGIGGSATTISGLYIAKDDIGIVEYWENNELTMQLIPCYRKSDNVAGYYDTVLHEFFTNAGTGTFEVGADVNKPELRMTYWKGDRLPAEYQELSYIESTGTQYILTDFIPTKTTNWEIKLSSTSGATNWAMGSPTWVGVHYKKTGVGITNASTTAGQKYAEYNYDDTPITLKLQDNSVYADGNLLGTITRYNGTQSFALFGYRNGNTATLLFTGKIYYVKLYSGEALTHNFVPCYRKSDNVVGMYDTVGGKFYTNSGTGTFKKGAYASLPDDYQQLTYIESTGTQWLDTGYAFKSDKARIEIKFMNTADNNGKNICSSSAENAKSFGFYQYQSDALTSYNGTNMTNRTPIPVKDGIVNASIETFGINTQSTSIINGVSFTANQTATIISNVTFGLFTKHDSNQSYIGTRLVKARIYLCKLWDNNVLVRDLIPCSRKSDGVIGMFDLVNATFHTNAGSGKFVKGSTKQDLRFFYSESGKLPSEYQALEYLDTDNQYFNSLLTYEACTIEQVVKFEPDTRRRLIGWSTNNTRYWGADTLNRYETGPSNFIPADKAIATEWHNVKFITDGKLTAPTATVLVDDKFSTTRVGSGSATLSTSYDYVTADYRSVAYFKFIKKILPDGTVKNNLHPCVRKSDNKVGWYDFITEQFLPNNCKAGQYKKTLRIIYM